MVGSSTKLKQKIENVRKSANIKKYACAYKFFLTLSFNVIENTKKRFFSNISIDDTQWKRWWFREMEAVTAGELDQHYCPPIRQPSRWLLNAPPIIEPCIRSIANRCLPNHISAVAVIQCRLHGGKVYFRRFLSKVFPDFFPHKLRINFRIETIRRMLLCTVFTISKTRNQWYSYQLSYV